MYFGVREIAAAISAAAFIFCCSCEEHHLGEDPEVQKENLGTAAAGEVNSERTNADAESPAATISPTPAEFFPESTPP